MSQDNPQSALPCRERRAILQAGALGTMLLLPGFNTHSVSFAAGRLSVAFVEDRHPEIAGFIQRARQFADSIVSVGADPWVAASKITAFDPAVTPLILGLTGAAAFTVMSQLALERGYNLVYRGVHRPLQAGVIEHRLQGKAEWTESIATALPRSGTWMLDLATALSRPASGFFGTLIAKPRVVETIAAGVGNDSRTWNSWVLSGRNRG